MVRRGAIAGQRDVPEHRDPQESPDIGVVRVGLERIPEEDQQVETGDTREELFTAVTNAMRALTDTPFGPVMRALLSQIAINPALGNPFRAGVIQARRAEVARVITRGVRRGDLRADIDCDIATEMLVGPVYFRLMFGGQLTHAFAERVVDALLHGYAARPAHPHPVD